MKKVLIITSDSGKTASWKEREAYVAHFAKTIEASLKNYRIMYTTYSDLLISVIKGKPAIYDIRNGNDLDTYSMVHFKNWQYESERASVVARFLEMHAIPFVNTEVNSKINHNKMSQMVTLAYEHVSVPDTLLIPLKQYQDAAIILKKNQFNFPLIVKADDGSKGDDNYLVKSQSELKEVLSLNKNSQFIFQKFIPNDGDYRILFIGLSQQPLVFLRKSSGETHLNNTSQGGLGTKLHFKQLPHEIRQSALRAAKIMNREIGGVDVIINKETNEHFILEVNSTPALATGFALEEKVRAFCKFLKENSEEKEEE